MNSAFDPSLWDRSAGPDTLPAVLHDSASRAISRAPRPTGGRLTRSTARSSSQSYAGTTVPGSGSITNGMFTGGLEGKKSGWYYDMPALSWGPRIGMAWDVTGDGKTAIRAAGGIFYNFINRSQYLYNGGPLIAREKVVRNATHRRCDGLRSGGHAVRGKPADRQSAG